MNQTIRMRKIDKLIKEMLSREGKQAAITGGSAGIGAATARLFARMGAEWPKNNQKIIPLHVF